MPTFHVPGRTKSRLTRAVAATTGLVLASSALTATAGAALTTSVHAHHVTTVLVHVPTRTVAPTAHVATKSHVATPAPLPSYSPVLADGFFYDPSIGSNGWHDRTAYTQVPGWQTTEPDHQIEIWSGGMPVAPINVANGGQSIELNANQVSNAYQDLSLTPGTTYSWSVYHHARCGGNTPDVANVEIGAQNGTLTTEAVMSDLFSAGWAHYTGTYTVPAGQSVTRFDLVSISNGCSNQPSYGNEIDDVSIYPVGQTACSIYWTGSTVTASNTSTQATAWENASNWSLNAAGTTPAHRIPTSTDEVCLATTPVNDVPVISSNVSILGIQFGQQGAYQPSVTTNWSGSLHITADPNAQIYTLNTAGGTVSVAAGSYLTAQTINNAATDFSDPGTITLGAGGTANFTNQYPSFTNGLQFVNWGTFNVPSNETIYFWNHSTLLNFAQLNLGTNSDLCDSDMSGNGAANELDATITANPGAGGTSYLHVPLTNLAGGTVAVTSGTLEDSAGATPGNTDAGTWTVASGATIDFGPLSTRTFSTTNTLSGAGTLKFEGTISSTAGAGITVPAIVDNGTYNIGAGTTSAPSSFTLGAGGKIIGTGTTTSEFLVPASSTFSVTGTASSPSALSAVTLLNASTSCSTAPNSTVDLSAGTVITNKATCTIGGGTQLLTTDSTPSSLSNLAGASLLVSNQPATTLLQANVSNAGSFNLGTNAVHISGSFSNVAGASLTSNVTWNGASATAGAITATSNSLAGTLALVTSGSPSAGSSFTVISGPISGGFSATSGTTAGSDKYVGMQTANSLSFTVHAPLSSNAVTTSTGTGYSPILVNGNFNTPNIGSGWHDRLAYTQVSGWQTTEPDHQIEIWGSTGMPVNPMYNGQAAELNANQVGALYQDMALVPGTTYAWSAYHHARCSISVPDVANVEVGAPGSTLSVLASMSDVTTAGWVNYSGTFTVPAGQTVTRFELASIANGCGSVSEGNLIDDVSLAPVAPNCSIYWQGTTSSNWSDAANWTTDAAGTSPAAAVPSTTDEVCMGSAPKATSVNVASSITVGGIRFGNLGGGNTTLTFTPGASLFITNDPNASVGNLVTSGGTVGVASHSLLTVNNLTATSTEFSGPGALFLQSGGTTTFSGTEALTNGLTWLNWGSFTVPVGTGVQFWNGSSMLNYGTVAAGAAGLITNADNSAAKIVNETGSSYTI